MSSSMNRRRCLQLGIKAAALPLLSGISSSALLGCGTLDRWFFEKRKLPDVLRHEEVLILGAGLAGLMAAYTLHQQKVPVRVFEASERIGGRILTLQSFSSREATVDLGGEWISSDQKQLLALLQELKLDVDRPSDGLIDDVWMDNSGWRNWNLLLQKQVDGVLKSLAAEKTQDEFDQLSSAEILKALQAQAGSQASSWMQSWIQWHWGCEPSQISALQVAHVYASRARLSEKKGAPSFLSESRFRIRGGARVLTQALADRIQGLNPADTMYLGHSCVGIERSSRGEWVLEFKTPEDRMRVRTKLLIVALPTGNLVRIDGWENLFSSPEQKSQISMWNFAQEKKKVKVLDAPGEKKKALRWWSGPEDGWKWNHAAFDAQKSGSWIQVQQVLRGEVQLVPRLEHGVDWSKMPWAAGSKSFLPPGKWLASRQLLEQFSSSSQLAFAGEQFSSSGLPSMAAAVESGLQAATQMLQLNRRKT